MPKKERWTTKMLNSYKSIDNFKTKINFTFNGGQTEFSTLVGATMSLLMIIIILTFTTNYLIQMIGRTNPTINTYVEYDFYSDNFVFDTTDPKYNFAFAFGIGGFQQTNTEDISDYGEIGIAYWNWTSVIHEKQYRLPIR